MTDAEPTHAFHVKCRPQGADALQLVLNHKRVFIGYWPTRRGGVWNRHNMRSSIIDLSTEAENWTEMLDPSVTQHEKQQITGNLGFVRQVEKGDIVVIPRPGQGKCYVGVVDKPFEFIDDPPWAGEYLNLRSEQNLEIQPEVNYLPDVVQSWSLEERPHSVAFPLVPRWIFLLRRNTIGWLRNRPDGRKAFDVLKQIYNNTHNPDFSAANNTQEVEARLMDWVSPTMFEHLVVELLQLEFPKERWWHTGGSGDCGADGLAVDDQGTVTAILQCKWNYPENRAKLASVYTELLGVRNGKPTRLYIATLYDNGSPASLANTKFLDRAAIADRLWTYKERCVLARTLGLVQCQ